MPVTKSGKQKTRNLGRETNVGGGALNSGGQGRRKKEKGTMIRGKKKNLIGGQPGGIRESGD